ncbi:MAG: hypothetical protein WAK86_01375, partial [Pseudonocardiaceae bacterium]
PSCGPASVTGTIGCPVMTGCFTAAPGVDVITTTADVPTIGSLMINAFVLHGSEPILVDTGTAAGSAEFMAIMASGGLMTPGTRRRSPAVQRRGNPGGRG